jgi:polyisoprenoid-binding protein YceI
VQLHLRAGLAAAIAASLLAGCALFAPEPAPAPTAPVAPPADFPEAYYRQAAAQGKPVFRVDPAASLVVIEVRRSGSLSRLGHDHVVASHHVGGYVAPEEGRGDLYVPLTHLTVDEEKLRAEAGFDTQPTESDIAGTRANMLEKVLEADKFPFALVRVNGARAGKGSGDISVALTLHGKTRTLKVPAQVTADGKQISVSGKLSLNQTDFGITPYSLFGGALAVRDAVDVRFRIHAVQDAVKQ